MLLLLLLLDECDEQCRLMMRIYDKKEIEKAKAGRKGGKAKMNAMRCK